MSDLEVVSATDDLRAAVKGLTPEQLEAYASECDPSDLALLEAVLSSHGGQQLEAYQEAPPGSWRTWMFCGGRGAGKSFAGAFYMDRYMRENDDARGRIIAPTLGDAREACVEGVSGLLKLNPEIEFNRSYGILTWPNGGRVRIFGAHSFDDVERLRAGGNSSVDWLEELAAWRQLERAWEQADLGLRIGDRPHRIITTTPKPRGRIVLLSKQSVEDPIEVVITRATTADNPHLASAVRDRFYEIYEGTHLGRQELGGELLLDLEGALWTQDIIERGRVLRSEMPALRRVVVGVDPSWGTTNDECGIVVAGVGHDGHGYVLADRSCRASPERWGAEVARAYSEFSADRVLAEVNFQAEQVRMVMKVTDPTMPFKEVRVSRGKRLRAEPVSALYERERVHHVRDPENDLGVLERQMSEWIDGESDFSPDRIDALVFAIDDLLLKTGPVRSGTAARRLLPASVLG